MTKHDFEKALEALKANWIGWNDDRDAIVYALKAQIDAKPLPEDVQMAIEIIEKADWTEPLDYVGIPVRTLIRDAKSGGGG